MFGNVGNQFGQSLGALGGNFGGGFQGFSTTVAPELSPSDNEVVRAKVAAWMQMLAPEPVAKRRELVGQLTGIQHTEATQALGRLAVFSLEKEIRDAAVAALKDRPSQDYTAVLLQGLRYPWPEFARYATEAAVRLERRDLVPDLVDFLDEPDPRAPVERDMAGRKAPVVRELVRLNHHHNCITCHAPAISDPNFKKYGFTSDFVNAPVSIPAPSTSPSYFGGPSFPDLAVRADVTYLRQDFSLMQKPSAAMTGAQTERFDFLVRVRAVKPQDVAAYKAWKDKQGPNYVSPNHRFALAALGRLTGIDGGETAAGWREALAAE
jgi:hypothetical protein